ncbi:MAG TPA: hypothetical protein ENJ35_01570 [Gammaproteobacteria bacterium]|nr:hypothetical protein [Gammaproteobacteria bacterium]
MTGIDYSSGKYGEINTTEIVYVPLTIKHSSFPWTAKVTIPYISITGPDSVTADTSGTVLTTTTSTTQSTDSGLGDTVASLGYALDTWWNSAPYVDLTGKIKFPTADSDKRLGTGETDYQAQVDIAHTIGGFTPFATLGYKIMGDTDITDFNNVVYASLGANQKLNKIFSVGFSYDFMEATTVTSSDRKEVMGYLNWKVNPAFSVNTYAVTGFTDASPDFAVGMQFTFKPKNLR